MSVRNWVEVIPGLTSLGAAYYYDGKITIEESDPELVILKSLKYYWNENDVFFMLYDLLMLRIAPLVHVERLVKMAKTGLLSQDELILLIVVADKLVAKGEHRFKMVRKKLYKKGMKIQKLPRLHSRPSFVKHHGAEEAFLEFGASVRKFLAPSDKKLLTLKAILKRNGWLKLRALMGPNYRADVIYLRSSGAAKNVSEAARMALCDYTATYRILKYSEELEHLEKVLGVS
ncbi:MAG: hypothetical protein KDD34_10050 [Bdellovibrionales bacterium]|nr:hypothetical protein [Bdellovibrionales bacterium]